MVLGLLLVCLSLCVHVSVNVFIEVFFFCAVLCLFGGRRGGGLKGELYVCCGLVLCAMVGVLPAVRLSGCPGPQGG